MMVRVRFVGSVPCSARVLRVRRGPRDAGARALVVLAWHARGGSRRQLSTSAQPKGGAWCALLGEGPPGPSLQHAWHGTPGQPQWGARCPGIAPRTRLGTVAAHPRHLPAGALPKVAALQTEAATLSGAAAPNFFFRVHLASNQPRAFLVMNADYLFRE
jgi:hypothetical protein